MVPPIATKRLSVDGRGPVVYQYKQPFRDGTHGLRRSVSTSFASRKSYFLRRLPLSARRQGFLRASAQIAMLALPALGTGLDIDKVN
jgi:hypothetical protein